MLKQITFQKIRKYDKKYKIKIFFENLTEQIRLLLFDTDDYIKYPKKMEKNENKWNISQKIQDIIRKV